MSHRFLLIWMFLLLGFVAETQPPIKAITLPQVDSLKMKLSYLEKPDTVMIGVLLDLAWELKSSAPDEALGYANQAHSVAVSINNRILQADALRQIGVIYWQFGSFQEAYERFRESVLISVELDDVLGVARTHANIGLVLMEKGHYAEALYHYFSALETFEQHGLINLAATVLNNIGRNHQLQGNHDLAIPYFVKSLEIKENLNDRKSLAFTFHDLGVSQRYQGEFAEALASFHKALQIREYFNDSREIANTVMHLGILHREMGNQLLARLNLRRALNLFEKVRDKGGLAQAQHQLGIQAQLAANFQGAIQLFHQSLDIARTINQSKIEIDNLFAISKVYEQMGSYNTALEYLHLAVQKRDSIFSEESRRKIMEMQYLHDHRQKLNEIEELQEATRIKESQIQSEQLLRNILIGGVFLFLLLLFFLYNRLLAIGQANEMLHQQQEKISESNVRLTEMNNNLLAQNKKIAELNRLYNESNQRLIESEKHLMEVNATKDKFFSIISHDLRNPFASIVSFSRILRRDFHNLDENELRELLHELDKSILKINNLLENLLQWSRSQSGRIKFLPEFIMLHDVVQENIHLFASKAKEKGIKAVVAVEKDLVVYADLNMMQVIIRNLLSNALKYSESGSMVEISATVSDGLCHVFVKDQGVGISPEQLDGIWDSHDVKTTYGTRDEKGSGLGLILCKEFVERNKGEISVESVLNQGTVFHFTVPISNGRN